ncbi:hypothetical protein [Streptacidiphilus sp. MAP12-20]|uniref:hypothetical protein n=1 Tax=Streptacidiphilus sp. MAP12-20 TaxID=3156299 RepID=UPI003517677D
MRPVLLQLVGLRVTAMAVAAALVVLGSLHLLGCQAAEAGSRTLIAAAAPAQPEASEHDTCCADQADLPAARTLTPIALADLAPAPTDGPDGAGTLATAGPAPVPHSLLGLPPPSAPALLLNCVSRT